MKLPLLVLSLATTLPLAAEITAVTHPEEKFPAQATVVWSPLFQAAWDSLNEAAGGKLLKIEPPSPLMEKLDHFEWQPKTVMPAGGWGVWSGPATAATLEKANREAAAITGEKEATFTLPEEDPESTAAFAVLLRHLVFEKALFRSTTLPMRFAGGGAAQDVKFFGVRGEQSENFEDQVKVLAYRPGEKCHALEIACKGALDSVVLYRPPLGAAQDFATASLWLKTWREAWKSSTGKSFEYNDPRLHELDEVKVPYLKLNTTVNFKERLSSLRYLTGKKLPQRITRAEQKVEFELHERGARVKVVEELGMGAFADTHCFSPPPSPRVFAYDAPFFVFLWKEGAEWPYFGAWVGDASAMEKWE